MIEDRRIARAAITLGYPVTGSGLVVCEEKHIGTAYGKEFFKNINELAQNFPHIFVDMLLAETMTYSNADIFAKKEHRLAMRNKVQLILVDPSLDMENTIREGRRINGLSPGMLAIYPTNPNPAVRVIANN